MLGVLKRRWKPKRSSGGAGIASEPSQEAERPRSAHQVHPVLDVRHLVGYEKVETAPPPPQRCLPLAPNICVEAGRIQFVRQDEERAPPQPPRVTVTRGLQTDEDEDLARVQSYLEGRIVELEMALEAAQKGELRDRQTISKLSKQLSRRDSAQRDADRERRLRFDSESRAKQAVQEAARCRSRLKVLTQEFARMEETVRAMLAYKRQAEQLRQEKAALTLAFENRCQQYQGTITRLNLEITALRQQLEDSQPEGVLQAHAAALRRHAEEARKQYERCLDDVANQVVKALLAQKGLREEVGCLNGRIEELEAQNRALTSMLVHQLRDEPDKAATPPSPSLQHCNSFNSDPEDNNCDKLILAGDTRFSLEDKKRHQMLTQLWTELKGGEVTPKRLLEALGAVDSALWVPPKRPVSLNLQLPARIRRTRPVLAQSSSRSEDESPESGNRDEGYSTMSSDVQADVTRTSNDATLPHRSLEDLKEASDETDLSTDLSARHPDVLYIPLNLLGLQQRNSFPPGKNMLPFQHIMRSFSDSHLCIKITATPTPCYSFASPLSSSPSIFLLDITEKGVNPLRRARASSALWGTPEERLECTAWDAEYIQQWLRLDECRAAPKDVLELEYDRADLEDWSLSLSSDELREHWKRLDAATPGQISIATLPSIQENNALELEEDANECLWNDSSYMMDKEGRELVTLLMDGAHGAKQWPYAPQPPSPDTSWSTESLSKRSSAASDDTGDLPQTDFTRDFYRLVKFESTRSLASTSGGDQGALGPIAEQQRSTREFSVEGPGPIDENYVTLKQLCEEYKEKVSYAEEVCVATALDMASERCSEMGQRPVDICGTVEGDAPPVGGSDSLASSVSTPETVVSRIPRPKAASNCARSPASKAPTSPATKIPKSKIPHKSAQAKLSRIFEGPPHRAVSFHERATSKDVIDGLNRLIKDEAAPEGGARLRGARLDQACRPTGWVHVVEKDVNLADPKARANLLDVMMASVSSDSSPTSSCGGSVAGDSAEDPPPDYNELRRIHKHHRQKKAKAARLGTAAVVRASVPPPRPSIIGRADFYVRYGEKEREAVASFDFLDEFSSEDAATAALDC